MHCSIVSFPNNISAIFGRRINLYGVDYLSATKSWLLEDSSCHCDLLSHVDHLCSAFLAPITIRTIVCDVRSEPAEDCRGAGCVQKPTWTTVMKHGSYGERLSINLSYLIINILLLILQLTATTCNGFIIFMFYKVKQLHRSTGMLLLLLVAITDFLHALTTLPYTIYLVAFTINPPINLNPYFIMFSSMPVLIQLKTKLTLTVATALQRTLALFCPIFYRRISSSYYAIAFLLLGVSLACVDLFFEFTLSPIVESPHCAALGCFVSDRFLRYWGTSNMIIGLFVILFAFMVLFKLHFIEKRTSTRVEKESNKFRQANRTSMGMLLSSLLFITLPSVAVGFVEMIGFNIFKQLGPFYMVGLLLAGTCNGIVYVMLNREMRELFKKFCSSGTASTTIILQSTANK